MTKRRGKAVQVEHIRLTLGLNHWVESTWFQPVESTSLSKLWFQMSTSCTPTARRGTTTYLVQRRLDMLPKPLTEDICSLRGGVERLAFSCFVRIDGATLLPDFQRHPPRFTKSVIRSDAALTYAVRRCRLTSA